MTMAYDPQGRAAYGAGPRTIDQAAYDAGLRQFMQRVYLLMGAGLLISGLVAYFTFQTPSISGLFFALNEAGRFGLTGVGWIAILAPLGIIMWMSFGARSMSAGTMQVLYWAFVTLQGVSLTLLFAVYTGASILSVFFITAASFLALSLYGYTTKRSLSGMGAFMMMGLFGIIIASVVNIFLGWEGLRFAISVAGVIIFAGLIAYDTQRLKEVYEESIGKDALTKTAVLGAVSLYLNFLNLFQFLLMLLGNRR
jgi:FtsH-binding integral membrane protein